MSVNKIIVFLIIICFEILFASFGGLRKAIKRSASTVVGCVSTYILMNLAFIDDVCNVFDYVTKIFFGNVDYHQMSRVITLVLIYLVARVLSYLIISIFIKDYGKENQSGTVTFKNALISVAVITCACVALCFAASCILDEVRLVYELIFLE